MKTFQIITNSSCNLRCTYCYEYLDANQNSIENIKSYLDVVVAKGASDKNPHCTIDLIGGEPFFVPDLLAWLFDYCLTHYKSWGYRCISFIISTNGTLLHKPKQLALLEKYGKYLSIGISIDGDKEKHDKHRLTIGGKGSFDDTIKGIDTAIKYIGRDRLSLKATFTKDSIQDYARSIKFLYYRYGNNVQNIQGNFNFEERFDQYDGTLIANESLEVVRYLQSHDFYAEFLFKLNPQGSKRSINLSPMFIKPKVSKLSQNRCGSCTHMLSLGYDGKLYGCNRFSTMKKEGTVLAEIKDNQLIDLNNPMIEEVKNAYQDLSEWCKVCRFNESCSDCIAIPIDEGIDHKTFYKQQRMCGYTKGTEIAKLYNHLLNMHRARRNTPCT